jgi:hypothetical protein
VIGKGVKRFSLATNAERVCAEIVRKQYAHDPEKCEAVFRKDHAQTEGQSAMLIHLQTIAL